MAGQDLAPVKHFSSVRKAREALRGQALELYQEFRTMIKQAAAAGKWEEALKAQQWLLDHTPGEDGERIFDSSSDKAQVVESAPRGPLVQLVGIRLGGVGNAKELPPPVDVTIIDVEGEDI